MVGYQNNYSNWLIYQGSKGSSFSATSSRDIEKNIDRKATEFEKIRIEELRNWAHSFFQENRIKFFSWWNPLREPADEDKAAKNNFTAYEVDMVLRTNSVMRDKKAIKFVDHSGKEYDLFLQEAPVLERNNVIKLRCVNV